MLTKEKLAQAIQRLQVERRISLTELSKELDIPKTSLMHYASGKANPRLDSLEMLAEKLGVSITELVSDPSPERERAETIVRAARAFRDLTPEQQDVGVRLFLELVALFSEET